jgi:DHA2 family methylenomycin A resistance protein-like MFS transporter
LCIAGLVAIHAWIPRQPEQLKDSTDRSRSAAPPSSTPSVQPAKRLAGIDPLGQVLAIVTLIALTGAVIEWRPLGLAHPLVTGGLVLALVASIALVVVEARVATPMLPLSMFGDRTFSAAVLFGICVNLTYYGTVFVLSLFLQRVRGYAPLAAGLAFLPLTGGFLISNVASGWVIGRHGVRVPMLIGAAIAALGYGLLHFVDANTPFIAMLIPFLLIPSGMGLAVPAMTTSVLASVEHARAGTASAVLNTARQAGGAAGVAAFGAFAGGAQAAHIVSGLQLVAAISVVLLIIAAALACLIHPESHAR